MTTRRSFLAVTLGAAALGLTGGRRSDAPADRPTAAPKPTATASSQPSGLARELARSLQRDLKGARLSDDLTAKIAADIQSNFDIAKAFRKTRLANGDEPDATFYASGGDR